MEAGKKEYTKLPGSGKSAEGVVSTRYYLWLGKDHLLSVIREGYYEQYKRFYFKDIQAIILRRTALGAVFNYISGILFLIFLALLNAGIRGKWDIAGIWTLGIFAGLFLLFLLVNWLKGPTCKCFLKTAVQTDRLYSLNRIRTAMRTIRLIAATVEAVQGKLSGDEAVAVENTSRTGQLATQPVQQPSKSRKTIRHEGGLVHIFLFSLLFIILANSLSCFFLPSSIMSGEISFMLYALIVTLALVAIMKQSNTDLPGKARTATWCTLVYLVVGVAMKIAFWIIISIGNSDIIADNIFSFPAPDKSVLSWIMNVYSAFFSGILGALGLLFVSEHRRNSRIPPPLAVPPALSTTPPETQEAAQDTVPRDIETP